MNSNEVGGDDTGAATHALHAMDEYVRPWMPQCVCNEGGRLTEMTCELLEWLVAYGYLQRLWRRVFWDLDRARHDRQDVGDAIRCVCLR